MLSINENEINDIIHNLLNIILVIKTVEQDCLTLGQKEILHGAETRLKELRQKLLESIHDENDDIK